MKTRDLIYCFIILILLGYFFRGRAPRENFVTTHTSDTVYMRDTIREVIPQPQRIYVTRWDTITVYVPIKSSSDTVRVEVPVPIEDKEYLTENFRALVRGYRPELVSMDIFQVSRTILNTEIKHLKQKPRFGLGIQVGCGFTGQRVAPYVGVGLHYNIWSF